MRSGVPARPNVLIFVADTFRAWGAGHLGNPAAVTPCLDRLVREDGISFRHAYCQSPVCCPSRCSIMTGWYPHVRGIREPSGLARAGAAR